MDILKMRNNFGAIDKPLSITGLTISLLIFLFSLVACSPEPDETQESLGSSESNEKQTEGQPKPTTNPLWRSVKINYDANRSWWHEAVFYEIWPRSFYDTDGDGNGDLKGISQKLNYLNDLGINAIWLTPIFEAPSYHGYDVVDYYEIEADYGTMADVEALIEQAHANSIKVVLDLVLNHVSNQHPWFLASVRREQPFNDYFIWSKTLPANYGKPWFDKPNPRDVWHLHPEREEWYYATFDFTQPDLNLKNPEVVKELEKVAAFWLDKGVDGFRLDAVRHFVEEGGIGKQADTPSNYAYLEGFRDFVKQKNPNALLVGEAFATPDIVASYYRDGRGLDLAFDFEFSLYLQSALDIAETGNSHKLQKIQDAIWKSLTRKQSESAPASYYAPFLSNHDLDRLSVKAGEDLNALKVAATFLLIAPGTPCLYYGEEIGMGQAGTGADEYRRTLMQWDDSPNVGFNQTGKRWMDDSRFFWWLDNFKPWWESYRKNNLIQSATVSIQSKEPESLYHHYSSLIRIKKSFPALQAPDEIRLHDTPEEIWLSSYLKQNQEILVLINLQTDTNTLFTIPEYLRRNYINLLDNETKDFRQNFEFMLDPGETLVLIQQ